MTLDELFSSTIDLLSMSCQLISMLMEVSSCLLLIFAKNKPNQIKSRLEEKVDRSNSLHQSSFDRPEYPTYCKNENKKVLLETEEGHLFTNSFIQPFLFPTYNNKLI